MDTRASPSMGRKTARRVRTGTLTVLPTSEQFPLRNCECPGSGAELRLSRFREIPRVRDRVSQQHRRHRGRDPGDVERETRADHLPEDTIEPPLPRELPPAHARE